MLGMRPLQHKPLRLPHCLDPQCPLKRGYVTRASCGERPILVLAIEPMLLFFRSFFGSKLGVFITLAFVGIIGIAFALGDVAGTSFGGFSSGSKIASVGSEKISATDLETQFRNIMTRLRQRNPQLSIKEFLAQDGLSDVLVYAMDGKAVLQWGDKYGLYVGDRLIDSEIAKDPNIQAPDGKVDNALYRQLLAQQGTTDSAYRTEQTQTLMAKLLLASNSFGLKTPRKVTGQYVAVLTEHRRGAIVTLPLAAFAPTSPPSDAEVTAWYNSHKAIYMLPERRSIRYMSYTDAAVKASAVPTDAEIAARYAENKAKYAASDKRKLSQMVLPNEAAAKQVTAEVASGKTLEAAAQAKGLAVAPLGTLTKDGYALQSSVDAANAVFAAPNTKVLGPFKAPLGWIVVRIDGRETTAGKTLEQAKPELVKELTDEKRKIAITDFGARIETELDNGATLGDMAKELGMSVSETPLLTANGAVFGQDGVAAPAVLQKVVPAAFQMDGTGQPQLAEVEAGKTFVIFDAGKIAAAAPPPLGEIRARVAEDARIAKGEAAAKAAAEKVQAQVQKGVPVDVAVASLGLALPPVDHVDMDRAEVQKKGKNASRPLQMLFAMAKGKVRLMQGPRNHGWFVVMVTEVIPGKVDEKSPQFDSFNKSLAQEQSQELGDQLRSGFRNEVGTTRNDGNLRKLQTQLSGGN